MSVLVTPEADRFVTDIDTAFVQQIFHISKRERETDIKHHRQADDLGAGFEIAKGIIFCYSKKLLYRPARFN